MIKLINNRIVVMLIINRGAVSTVQYSRKTDLFTAILCLVTMWLSDWYMCNIKINLHGSFLPTAFFLF